MQTFSCEKRLASYFNSEILQAKEALHKLRGNPQPSIEHLARDRADLELGWEDHGGDRQHDLIAGAAYILRNPAGDQCLKRTIAQNRQWRERNCAKVRPMLVQFPIGQLENLCECPERKEKSVLVISLTGIIIQIPISLPAIKIRSL